MKIAIDIDETIVEFFNNFLKFVKTKGIKEIKYKDIYTYNLTEVLEINRDFLIKLVDEYNKSGFFNNPVFINGAKEGVEYLIKNYDVYFITSRPESIVVQTKDFIFREFGVLKDRIIFSGDHFGGNKRKDEICKELGIDLIIEDAEYESLGYAQNGLRVLLLNKPWNKKILHDNVFRCKDWSEILDKVKDLSNG